MFEIELSPTPLLRTIRNVPLVSTGDYDISTGKVTFSEKMLAGMIKAAQDDSAVKPPRLKLGHEGGVFADDVPAFGVVDPESMYLGDNGQTLYGNYVGVPPWLAEVLPYVWPSRSIEADRNVTTPTGNHYDAVLTAVALLGISLPGVATLDDLKQIATSATIPDVLDFQPELIAAATAKEVYVKPDIAAAVAIDDIRQAYYDGPAANDYNLWIRSMTMNPNSLIVQNDGDGSLLRVDFSVDKDDAITFSEPVSVKIVYEDLPKEKTAATAAPAAIYASRAESRPEPNNKETATMDLTEIRKRLNLGEDVSDEEVVAQALAAIPNPPEVDPTAGKDSTQNPSTGNPFPGTPTAPAPYGIPDPAVPQPGTQSTSPEPVAASAADGTVRVDKATWDAQQATITEMQTYLASQRQTDRQQFVDAAVRAGKFPPARRDHYLALMSADEDGTRQFIDTLAAGAIPMHLVGQASSGQDVMAGTGGEAYPDEWLNATEKRRKRVAASGGQPDQIILGKDG